MASYFGARDFGDPRHNVVPRIMEYEKATGQPFVPPLWEAKKFPGQVSYPVLYHDSIPGVRGSDREKEVRQPDGTYERRAFMPRGSQSARERRPRTARSFADLPADRPRDPPLSSRTPSRVTFERDLAAADKLDAETAAGVNKTGRRWDDDWRNLPRPMSARPIVSLPARRSAGKEKPLPEMDEFTAAGVAELVKNGFPPQAALSAWLKICGPTTTRERGGPGGGGYDFVSAAIRPKPLDTHAKTMTGTQRRNQRMAALRSNDSAGGGAGDAAELREKMAEIREARKLAVQRSEASLLSDSSRRARLEAFRAAGVLPPQPPSSARGGQGAYGGGAPEGEVPGSLSARSSAVGSRPGSPGPPLSARSRSSSGEVVQVL